MDVQVLSIAIIVCIIVKVGSDYGIFGQHLTCGQLWLEVFVDKVINIGGHLDVFPAIWAFVGGHPCDLARVGGGGCW